MATKKRIKEHKLSTQEVQDMIYKRRLEEYEWNKGVDPYE